MMRRGKELIFKLQGLHQDSEKNFLTERKTLK